MIAKLYRFGISMNYRWCMANAYLTQHYAPMASAQWERDADNYRMELWRLDRGLLQ